MWNLVDPSNALKIIPFGVNDKHVLLLFWKGNIIAFEANFEIDLHKNIGMRLYTLIEAN